MQIKKKGFSETAETFATVVENNGIEPMTF
jgi:hypothetical protein